MKRLWVVRAGKFGEREDAALASGRLQPGFDEVPNLSSRKDCDAILEAVFRAYERLPEEIRKALPLKRTWTMVLDEAG